MDETKPKVARVAKGQVRVLIQLHEDDVSKLDAKAKIHGAPRNGLIREAVRWYLEMSTDEYIDRKMKGLNERLRRRRN
jgi:hypothetical protein